METIEEICERCEHHLSVFEGYLGAEAVENARFICSSERFELKRDLYCSNGYDCEVIKNLSK